MNTKRTPAAFRLPAHEAPSKPATATKTADAPADRKPRRPRAVRGDDLVAVKPDENDYFEDGADAELRPLPPAPRRSRLAALFLGATGILISLAVGLWVDRLVRELFARADWLGWTAIGLTALAGAALVAILMREVLALMRLASVERMRRRADDVVARADAKAARDLTDDLSGFLAAKPETAAGRTALEALRDDVIDAPDLIALAETELLGPLDGRARQLVLDAGKRVSLVTAVSPRALVDLAYVLYETARLVRRIADLYGGRPGTLGFLRLTRSVLAHLAVTGSIAAGDSLVQQLVGHGLAARLSAKLGEGVVNGMMTVRIGIAAMEAARPLPFRAQKRPGLGDFLSALTRLVGDKAQNQPPSS
ncbi:YcjF family protein [Nitratireductor alexandrii]|uniref:YcjF family protein n=1 Tax=Nitratireductor alexandrii TaxID=2448161 RepID=UPI000FDC5573|nr:TIGR01620 family protein [Nitratireductor alexandrii]